MTSYEWPPGGSSGTLTSVGLADGSSTPIYNISGSPVTTAGTLTFSLKTEAANLVFAGPTTGSAAQPTFRALVAADLPAGAVLSMGTFGSTPNSAGGSITAQVLTLQPADGTNPGGVSTGTQTLAGAKTFSTSVTTPILKSTGSGSGTISFLPQAAAGTYNFNWPTTAGTSGYFLTSDGGGAGSGMTWTNPSTLPQGTVTTVSVVSANGFAGTVATATSTPAITLTTTITGVLKGNGTAISAQTVGNLTEATSSVLTIGSGTSAVLGSGTTIQVIQATTSTSGYLSSTDWNTFNSKGAGSVTSVSQTVPAFLSIAGSPITTSGTLAISLSGTALPIANGGTAVTSVTTAPAATAFAGWDANKNLSANSLIAGYRTTATAAGTTTLVVGDALQQYFTGSSTQTVVLPVTSTLVLGQQYQIINNSTGVVTVQSSGANTIQAMAAGTALTATVILTSGTTAASWSISYIALGTTVSVTPTIQTFTSGSGTYTTPAGAQYILVKAVGGGGGGGGGGVGGSPGDGGDGTNTTFGTSLIVAGLGHKGLGGSQKAGGAGGTASLGTGPSGTATPGGNGGGNIEGQATNVNIIGAMGGNSFYGGAGGNGYALGAGTAAATNSGSGGGGGGSASSAVTNSTGGSGGGSGGYVEGIISSPSATYAYVVGTGGSGGSAGTNGGVGGAGAAGYLEITAFYVNLAISTSASVSAGTFLAGPTSGSAAVPTFRALQTPTIQKFTSGSGTYTAPAGVLYIRVRMVGSGGSGSGSATGSWVAANDGNDTTFGLHTAAKGLKGGAGNTGGTGGAGGSGTIGAGAAGSIIPGNGGGAGDAAISGVVIGGAGGGSGIFGGGATAQAGGNNGVAGIANSGGGGGGAALGSGAGGNGGGGGGGLDIIIAPVSSTYSYAVGASASGGAAGTGGNTGGASGSGYIEVVEFFQ